MSIRSVALVALVVGCSGSHKATIDAPPPDVMMEHCQGPTIDAGPTDFFGETCMEAEVPAGTLCHTNLGWCVDAVCRPQCAALGCPRCLGGRELHSDRGACYCAP